jgi:hypothetical protein
MIWAVTLERAGPGGVTRNMPTSAADLMTKLSEVGQPAAADVLVWLLSTTMAYGGPDRSDEGKALDMVDRLAGLFGHGTQWWVLRVIRQCAKYVLA